MKQVIQLLKRNAPAFAIGERLYIFLRRRMVKKRGNFKNNLVGAVKTRSYVVSFGIESESPHKTFIQKKVFVANPSGLQKEFTFTQRFRRKMGCNFRGFLRIDLARGLQETDKFFRVHKR